jgi:hypothetical protein
LAVAGKLRVPRVPVRPVSQVDLSGPPSPDADLLEVRPSEFALRERELFSHRPQTERLAAGLPAVRISRARKREVSRRELKRAVCREVTVCC